MNLTITSCADYVSVDQVTRHLNAESEPTLPDYDKKQLTHFALKSAGEVEGPRVDAPNRELYSG